MKEQTQINHPDYYNQNGLEAIDFIEAFNLNFNLGNVVKYIVRAGRKTDDSLADLQKAEWYLAREIEKYKVINGGQQNSNFASRNSE